MVSIKLLQVLTHFVTHANVKCDSLRSLTHRNFAACHIRRPTDYKVLLNSPVVSVQ